MPPKAKPGPNDVPLFEVQQTVQHGYDLMDTPTVTTEFIMSDPNAPAPPPTPATPAGPEVITGESGTYMDVKERAQVLQKLIPLIAEHAKLEKLPAGLHTERGPQIQTHLEKDGKTVNRRLHEVDDHKKADERLIWKTIYENLGYEALGKVEVDGKPVERPEIMRRYASEDRYRMLEKYGAGKGKEREAFQKQLDVHAPRPKKPRKRKS